MLGTALCLLGPGAPRAALAQSERSIEGRLSLPGRTARGVSVAGAWVTLHRVGPDTAGPLDSVRTAAGGGYRFRYRAFGDSNAVYFVSTNRGGVNYFTPPVRERAVRGGIADLIVFDTTSAPVPISIRGRHVIVTVPDSATGRNRTVLEAFELSNDSTVTRVAAGDDGVTFDVALPPGVTVVVPGQGDVSAEAISVVAGRVQVNAPISPGLRQVTYSYEIPTKREPIEMLVEQPATVLEVLVEEPQAIVTGAGLVNVDAVTIDGRPFRRFLAQDVAAAQVIRISIPPSASASSLRLMMIVTAVGAAMLLGLGTYTMRRGSAVARRRDDDPEALALEIAALDAAYERVDSPNEEQKGEHYMKRAQLKGRLNNALAKREGLA